MYEQTFGIGGGGIGSGGRASNSNILKAPKAFIKGGTLDPSDTSLNVIKFFFFFNFAIIVYFLFFRKSIKILKYKLNFN